MNTRRLLIITLCAFCAALGLRLISREFVKLQPITERTVAPASTVSAASRSLRPNYPYSVIAGGAYSPAELRSANDKDKVVREHYADFDLEGTRLVTLTEDRYQYVSYRVKNRVYWTHHKLRIPKGEVLLTDGRSYCRTRCGNRLSSKAQPNTALLQPSERLLSLPAFRPELLSTGDITLAPPLDFALPRELSALPFDLAQLQPAASVLTPLAQPTGQSWAPFAVYPPATPVLTGLSGPSPLAVVPGGSPVSAEVPEPASLYLFGTTFLISLWFLIRMMRVAPGEKTKDS